ncbi:aromatic hydrocarbon degradation protein [Thioalkalivibrio denitrificans]|uniref:Aromatic hydrocarbon degradation protein n=1 Tax=Thioalkalivibrio denitrificans TaxID=108003 RepID=A0A1V3NUG5_9GAMM|nr:outer membrane protein transport protein [Thioalkalivibrio denitrificans]OOG28765.1 aromatic hydrocarbon degradation protein [Thioalkalivibrio denitrificans]
MRGRLNRYGLIGVAGLVLGAAPGLTLAAGFYIQHQSGSGQGRAFAGESAIAADASTVYFNPAGMTRLEAAEFQVAVHFLMPEARLRDKGSTAVPAVPDTEQPVIGGDGGNPYDHTPVPNLFYAQPVNDRTWVGLGITAPFGLASDYDDDFFARYDSTETSLRVTDIAPSIAVQLNDRVSIGGGINIQYADATLKSAILNPSGPAEPQYDIEFSLSGDSWDYGFNVGVLVDLSEDTRLGIHYRQAITHTLKGTARTRPPVGAASSQSGQADLKLPDIVSIGLSHRFSDRWTGLAQYTWFNWSNFDEIRIKRPGEQDQVIEQNYRNTWALALGAEYLLNERWTLRSGIQYDVTPTRDDYRSTRTPDGNRTWYSVGAGYQRDSRLGFDFAYTYINVAKQSLNLTRNAGTGPVHMIGSTEGQVQVVAASLRYRF